MVSAKSFVAVSALTLGAAAAPGGWGKSSSSTPCETTPTSTPWGTPSTSSKPWGPPTTSKSWGTPSTSSKPWGPPTTTIKPWGSSSPTGSGPKPTSTGGFLNACQNFGISILDCTQLGNIAAGNGNTIIIGGPAPSGTSTGGSGSGNGGQFLNVCKNFGISIADCAQLLNLSLLNGNTIDISGADLTSLVSVLGISATGLGGLVGSSGLIPLPTGLL